MPPPRKKEGVRGRVPGGFQRQSLWPPKALSRGIKPLKRKQAGTPAPHPFSPPTPVRRGFLPDARAHASEGARMTPPKKQTAFTARDPSRALCVCLTAKGRRPPFGVPPPPILPNPSRYFPSRVKRSRYPSSSFLLPSTKCPGSISSITGLSTE